MVAGYTHPERIVSTQLNMEYYIPPYDEAGEGELALGCNRLEDPLLPPYKQLGVWFV